MILQIHTLTGDGAITAPCAEHAIETAREWQRHLDASRIGTHTPTPPEIAANRARTEALFGNTAFRRSFTLNREGL
jgi:hypothetical protein